MAGSISRLNIPFGSLGSGPILNNSFFGVLLLRRMVRGAGFLLSLRVKDLMF